MILIDLDHFKHVNDKYGHHTGDKVLMEFAKTLRANTKGRDTVARWGGEEFILLLPDTTLENAAQLLDTVKLRFSQTKFVAQPHEFTVTFSAGLVELKQSEECESALKRADELLYQAKAAGRNRALHDGINPFFAVNA
ncbi:GGDEF domain-containing protein [Glaciecola sp. XM2]|jgi:diguanylate cyclase (GGDEF)-like protein|uniref:GGDEF domain-containing protein n=1 Tax=Glaciecola sp. XM2 TaxID=1914931 RepID=UPI00203243F5|nr:GGDEF domain-containing protein [Glaciecola sp. XM2]